MARAASKDQESHEAGLMVDYLAEVEEMAEDILADKRQMVDLDKRRQKTREAIRVLQKDQCKKNWVCMGNMFLKLPAKQTKKFLNKDFDEFDNEISDIRKRLKPKVNKIRDMQDQDSAKGFQLKALSKEELRAINNLL